MLFCIFFGLIGVLCPSGRAQEWIGFLLIVVLFLSVGSLFVTGLPELPDFSPVEESVEEGETYRVALHAAVSSEVVRLTGAEPLEVTSDLSVSSDRAVLSEIRVTLRSGDPQEVYDGLEKAFSFRGFTVVGAEGKLVSSGVSVLP